VSHGEIRDVWGSQGDEYDNLSSEIWGRLVWKRHRNVLMKPANSVFSEAGSYVFFQNIGPYLSNCKCETSKNKEIFRVSCSNKRPPCLLRKAELHTVSHAIGIVQWRTEGGGWGVQTPPPEIPKISVESSIAWARKTGISISFCSSLCSHTVVIY